MKQILPYILTLSLLGAFLQGCNVSNSEDENLQLSYHAGHGGSPDLIVTDLVITSQTSQNINFYYTIKNQGLINITNIFGIVIQAYYSTDHIYDPSDVAAGGRAIFINKALNSGQTYTATSFASGSVPAGKRFLIIKVDASNVFYEADVTNNFAYKSTLAQLIISTSKVNSITAAGVNYSYSIQNTGTKTVPDLYNVAIKHLYSLDNLFSEGTDINAGISNVGVHVALAPGQIFYGSATTTGAIPTGKPWMVLQVDYTNIVEELFSGDTDAIGIAPDLSVTNLTITSRTSTKVSYSFSIKNKGNASLGNLKNVIFQCVYSVNNIFGDGDDINAGARIIGSDQPLAPNQSYSSTFQAPGVPTGKQYLIMKIDFDNIVVEPYETNNTFAVKL